MRYLRPNRFKWNNTLIIYLQQPQLLKIFDYVFINVDLYYFITQTLAYNQFTISVSTHHKSTICNGL